MDVDVEGSKLRVESGEKRVKKQRQEWDRIDQKLNDETVLEFWVPPFILV